MTEASTGTTENGLIQFSLGKTYLKDVSVEAPNSPEAFLAINDWNPKLTIQYNIDAQELPDDMHNVLLTITITAADDTKTMFLIEVQQGGIFVIRDYDSPERLNRMLNVRCPRILFPYAREAVDNLIVKAGFPPLMLGPLDFKHTYEQSLARSEK